MKNKGLKKRNSSESSQIGVNTINEGERENTGCKSMEISQVEVCDICGHVGFINALMYCSVCSRTAVHQYCLGILPGSIDDAYHWLCEYCLSMESEHQDSSFKESFKELTLARELETEQYKKEIVLVEEELEPLCILPPLVHQGNSEHQCRNNSSTFINHSLISEEKHEPADLIQRNVISCVGSYYQIAEGFSGNGSVSLDQPFNDREECEASVSPLMEFPNEIISGLVLLVSLSGNIIIQRGMSFCSCLAPSIVNMTNGCNEMKSEKVKPHLASYLDKPVENVGEVAYDCVDQERVEFGECSPEVDKDVGAGQSNVDLGFSEATVYICQENTGEDADDCQIKHKRTSAQVKLDLLQPLGLECKRIRSKRCKISSFCNKEAGACKFVDFPSIGKEGRGRPTNASEIVMLKNTCHRTGEADTLVNVESLMRNGLQVGANE